MTILLFLIQWAIRSCLLVLCGAGLVWALRMKNAFVRMTVWTALLAGSLAIPALTLLAPTVPVAAISVVPAVTSQIVPVMAQSLPDVTQTANGHFDWVQLALALYVAVAALLLLRVLVGIVLSRGLLRDARMTDRDFRETHKVTAPLVLGILRPILLLPGDWREWDRAKLDAVLAHERSHIARHDPMVQMLSALHRAALWISPASWLLHALIVRTAEEVSDAAAVAQTGDRVFYAEVLLGFMQHGIRRTNWLGVPMARYGWVDRRIQRILNNTKLFPALTRWSLTAIMATVSVLSYLIATAQLSEAAPGKKPLFASIPSMPDAGQRSMETIGTVTANTVAVTANVDGQLASTGCMGGRPVRAGQVLAMIQSLSRAYTPVKAPISGLAGFCKVDPGNPVHPGETLLTITQLHPIAVMFSIPQDYVSRVRARLASGAPLKVEVYDRNSVTRLATGRVSAIDNAIDKMGLISLKASFENKDGALFPNAFVNVRVLVDPQGAKRP